MAFVSIVTAMYDRAGLIGRAIESVLAQDYDDFELVVVDDGSTDGSADVVRRYPDPRVRLIRYELNRGVSPARNSGVDASRGEWILVLDSDDELLPGALTTIAQWARRAPDDVDRLAFMFRLDGGGLSPDPPLSDAVWGYEDYVRWLAQVNPARSDFSNCIRRRTFETLRFPEDRSSEALYHLDFARRFRTRTLPDVVALVHSDATNRADDVSICRLLACAPDNAHARRLLLARHEAALRRFAPERLRTELRVAAIFQFLARERVAGTRYVLRLLRERRSVAPVLLWGLGLFGPSATAAALVARTRLGRRARSPRAPVTRSS